MSSTCWLEKLSGFHNKVASYTRGCVALHRPCSNEHTLQFANLPTYGLAKYIRENLMHLMHKPSRRTEICELGYGPLGWHLAMGFLFIIVVTGWINWNNEEALDGAWENFDLWTGWVIFSNLLVFRDKINQAWNWRYCNPF